MDGKDVQKILGMSVKELRLAKGLTQERLAELINKQPNTINRIETGVNFVKSDTLADLANVFGVHPGMVFWGQPAPQDLMEKITLLLQTFSPEKRLEVYKILKAMDIE